MLVNRATEYFDNAERILLQTTKQLPSLYENDEWIFEEWRETHILKGRSVVAL